MTTRTLQQVIESVATSDGAGVKLRRSIGSGQAARHDRLQPLGDEIGIGQRGQQEAVIAPLARIASQKPGGRVRRIPVVLLELAPHHVGAIAARGVRQHLEPVVLLDRVDDEVDRDITELAEVLPEAGEAVLIVVEAPAIGDLPAAPVGHGGALYGDADEELVGHLEPVIRDS